MRYNITNEQSKRINIMKMLFALFVVLIHSNMNEVRFSNEIVSSNVPVWLDYYRYFLSEAISRCAVPGFYFLSSLLLYRKEFTWKSNVVKRIKTLLVPYLIMNSFWIIAYAIGESIPQTQVFFHSPDTVIANFGVVRWLQAYGIGAQYPFLYPLWFIRNLLILNVFAVLIKRGIDAAPKLSLLIICGMFLLLKNFPLNNFGYNLYVTDFCMWCFGYFVVKFKWNLNQFDKSKKIAILYILVLLIRTVMKNSDLWVLNFFVARANMVLGIIFWYGWFSKSLNKPVQKLLLRYSAFNFGVYLFHEMNLSFCNKLIVKIFGTGLIIQIIRYTMIPIFIVFLTVVLSIFLKKYTPRFFAILTGSRT